MENINDEPSGARINTQDERYVKNEEEEEDWPPGATEDEKREERELQKYSNWLKTILTSEQKKMTLETPLTDDDCEFLKLLSIPAVTGQKELNWENVSPHRGVVTFKEMLFLLPFVQTVESTDPHDDKYDEYEEEIKLKDEERMENIEKLLMTVDTTEQRKRIARQYLNWFKTILNSEQKKVTLETPLTDGDCEFLRVLSIPAVTGQKELNWQNLSDRHEIQLYAVLLSRFFHGPLGTTENEKRMENIKKLLMTVDTTEQRKRIVRRYLDWFKTILTSEQKKVTLETPLNDGDCEFLRVLSIPAVTGQKELNWQNLSDRDEIRQYGVVFKQILYFTDKAWDELQNILDDGR